MYSREQLESNERARVVMLDKIAANRIEIDEKNEQIDTMFTQTTTLTEQLSASKIKITHLQDTVCVCVRAH